jgi:hypothetical protein
MAVPLFDTGTPLAPHRQAIIERIAAVVGGGHYVLGPEVTEEQAGEVVTAIAGALGAAAS